MHPNHPTNPGIHDGVAVRSGADPAQEFGGGQLLREYEPPLKKSPVMI